MNTTFAASGSATAGRRGLVKSITDLARMASPADVAILNVGAGTAVILEQEVWEVQRNVIIDRVDVVDPSVTHPAVREAWRSTVEDMPMVASDSYDIVCANFVLEHVCDVKSALREIHRVLRPGGHFVATVPNPNAPEFLVARHTPTRVHRIFQHGGFDTHYSFRSIPELLSAAGQVGLVAVRATFSPDVGIYLQRTFPRLAPVGHCYDRLALRLESTVLLGQCCLDMIGG